MDKIFKDKYEWNWCFTCNQAVIICLYCGNTSCNGFCCEICREDFAIALKVSKPVKTKEEFNNTNVFHRKRI